ncbi:hypothetical protein EXS71_02570 [Candidatus Uhrbacteria bacterium]|nr:hypothetical protein [Candidatus Uhrbacteria bacterium]
MRILIVTPLYPPDIDRLAIYAKELASRLTSQHQVSVMTYGSIPEEVSPVRIFYIPKNWSIFLRMIAFLFQLWRAAMDADLLYVCDGAAVGLPSTLISWLRGIPLVRYVTEDEAAERKKMGASKRKVQGVDHLQRFVLRHATRVIISTESLKNLFSREAVVLPLPAPRAKLFPPIIEQALLDQPSFRPTILDNSQIIDVDVEWKKHVEQLRNIFSL